MAVSRLADALSDLLDGAADALTDHGVEVPARRYRAHGPPADDGLCDALTVYAEPVRIQPLRGPGNLPASCQGVLVARLVARVARCWAPAGYDQPGDDTLDLAGQDLAEDGWALIVGLSDRALAGTLFPTAGLACDGIDTINADPFGPDGGVAGWTVTIETALNA